jgi:hypothetical protein
MIIRSSVDVCPTSIASQIFSPSKRSSSSIKVYQSFNPFSLHTLCLPEPCPIETSSDAVLQAAQSCWSAGCWCWEVCNPLACFKRLTFVGKTRYLLAGAVGKKHRNSAGNKCLPFPNFPKYVQHLKSHILVWVSIEYPYDWMLTTKNRLRAPRIGQGSVTLSTDLGGTAGRGKNCSTVRKLIL